MQMPKLVFRQHLLIIPVAALFLPAFGASLPKPGSTNNLSLDDVKKSEAKSHSSQAINDLEASIVLKRMLRQYQTVKSYKSSGAIKITYTSQLGVITNDTVSCRLYFMRPKSIRLEWRGIDFLSNKRAGTLWSNGSKIRLYSDIDGFERLGRITDGMDSVEGLSGGDYLDANLLINDRETLETISKLRNLKPITSSEVNGEACYVIEGEGMSNLDVIAYKLWVSKKSYFLRKVEDFFQGAEGNMLVEENYADLKINGRLPRKVFNSK